MVYDSITRICRNNFVIVAYLPRKVGLAAMMRAASEALQTLAKDRLGGRLGIMVVLHTWGRTLIWHPHVHCLIPGFVVCPDGGFKKISNNYLLPLKPLSKVYRAVFLRIVRSQRDAPRLPTIQWSKQWVANCRTCTEGPANVLKYLARYTKRGPLPEKASSASMTNRSRSATSVTGRNIRRKVSFTPKNFCAAICSIPPNLDSIEFATMGFLAPGARRTLRSMRMALLIALATLAPVIAELRERSEKRSEQTCPHCGASCFIRIDFIYPNRRGPAMETNSMTPTTSYLHLISKNANIFYVRDRLPIAWMKKSALISPFFSSPRSINNHPKVPIIMPSPANTTLRMQKLLVIFVL